jgi:MFS family permease
MSALNRYFLSLAAHFCAGGTMGVVMPWLLTHELNERQDWVGVAQMIGSLPMTVLVLIGGAAADGRDLRGYVGRLQIAAAAAMATLAYLVWTSNISFQSVTAAMFAISLLSAFITPARDALLSHVVPHSLGLARAVPMTVAATFGGQLVGTALGAAASSIGATPLLLIQTILLLASATLVWRLTLVTPFDRHTATPIPHLFDAAAEGFKVAWRHERLRTILLYLVLAAPLFNGWFMVGIPLMLREVYAGTSAGLSLVYTVFLLGLTLSSFAFSYAKPVERPGKIFMLLSLNNVLVFAGVYFTPPYEVFVALMFWWGLVAGVGMAITRAMVQVAAPHAYRARVLSLLQFANVAGGPPGSLMYGYLAEWVEIQNAVLVVPAAILVLWTIFRLTTNLWHFRREDAAAPLAAAPVALD